jgi:tetratricopeptide (TPR) repeat protein
MAGQSSELLAILAAALFLLHPVQTESVAYIAGRSETLSVFFFLLAYTAFLYRLGVLAVLLPFFAAVLSKEHTVVLPALLLLTDFVFGGSAAIRRNLKLYVPIALLGVLGAAVVLYRIANAPSAGFGLKEFTWYQYLFTQFSVIWTYLRLFVLPVGLTADYQYPVSRTILDNGAIFWGLGLLALAYVAWRYRRTYPLAFLGFVAFLLLLAPTSSVVPIADVIAERRLYLPMLGLLLVVVDVVRRAALPRHTVAAIFGAILLAAAFATHSRASVWGDPIAFWQDTVNKGEGNARARFQLAFAQWQAGRCSEAAANFEKTAQMRKPDTALYVDWALALDCENRPDEAVAKLREALKAGPNAHVLGQIGMIYGKRGRFDEALVALDEAEKVDPMFDVTYVYKGNVYAARGDRATAETLYKRALSINPNSETALSALQALR